LPKVKNSTQTNIYTSYLLKYIEPSVKRRQIDKFDSTIQ